MKKIIILLFTFLYLATATGVELHFHYCNGRLAEWGLDQHQSCSLCGNSFSGLERRSCCQDLVKEIKLGKTRLSSVQHIKFQQIADVASFAIAEPFSSLHHLWGIQLAVPILKIQLPPPIIYILFRMLRI